MQKFLRVLAVLALMLLPTVAKAQYTVTVADGTSTNAYVPIYGYYADAYLRSQSIYPASMLTAISTGDAIYEMKFYTSNTSVSWGDAEFEVKLGEVTETSLTGFSTTALTSVYTGSLSVDDYGYMTIEFDNAYTYGGGNLMLEITETETGDYVSASFIGMDAAGASWQGYSYTAVSSITGSAKDFLAKVTISYGSAPTCIKVSNVTVTDATSSSLSLSWVDTVNTGAGYTVYNMSDTSVVATVASGNTCTVNGLNANTLYTLGVVANCSATENSGFTLVAGRTACADGDCMITIVGTDSYGDGWNGNAINVYYDTTLLDVFTLISGSYNEQNWCLGGNVPVNFSWASGGTYSYPGEADFNIVGNTGVTLFSANGSELTDGVTFFNLSDACADSVSLLQYTFTLLCDPTQGSVTGGGIYTQNDTVTFTATPNTNYVFDSWTFVAVDEYGDSIDSFTASANPLMFIAKPSNFGTYTDFVCTASFIYQGPVACSGTSCYLTVVGHDSYGDGWNGGALAILQNDTVVGSMAVTDSNAVAVFEVCNDYPVYFYWISGSWGNEVSFYVTNSMGDTVVNVNGAGDLNGVFSIYNTICTNPTEMGDTTVISDMVTITVMAADSTMGYTTGSGVYSVDSLFIAIAYPYTGYHFLQWMVYDGMGDYFGYTSANPFTYYCDDNYLVVAIFEADAEPIDCSGTSCYLTVSGTDSWGDGWNGGELRLMQNDNLVGIFVVDDSAATQTFEICNDYPVNFLWNGGQYDGEVAFTVSSAAGATILSVASASSLVDGNVFAMVTDPCTNPVVVEQHDTISITIAVNNATMGTTVPAPGTYSYSDADTLWLSATPYAGYNFVNWTVEYYIDGALQTTVVDNQSTGFLVSGLVALAPLTFTANFATPAQYSFNLTCDPLAGTVTGGGMYNEGDTVVFTATANTDYVFMGWELYALDDSGNVVTYFTATNNPLTFIASENTFGISNTMFNCYALFEHMAGVECSGTSCYLTVSGTDDYGDGWNGGVLYLVQNDTTVGIFMVDSTAATQTFEVCNDYPVNFVWSEGSWDSEVAFTVSTADGTSLFAINDITVFDYDEALAIVTYPCSTSPVVVLNYDYDTVTVTIAVNNPTMGTTTPAPGTYSYLGYETIDVVATPYTGYYFIGWVVSYTYYGTTYSDTVINPSFTQLQESAAYWAEVSPLTFTALFSNEPIVVPQYTFNLTCDPAAGTVTGGGVYDEGATVTFTATANANYVFTGWELYALDDSGNVVTYFTATSNPLTFTASESTFGISNTVFNCYALFEYMGGINCGGTSCNLTVYGTDSYGDGWNGGSLYLYQNDTIVGVMIVEDSMAVSTFEVCDDYPVNFVWNGGEWDGEVAFTVSNAAGTAILSVASASALVDGNVFAIVTDPCTNPVVVEQHDTIAITIAVNDASLGTTQPGPGTYYYTEADTLWLSAIPSSGNFFVDWTVDYFVDGVPHTQSMDDYDMGFLVSSLINFAPLTFTANFSSTPVGEITDTVVCTYSVNNPTMGTTNPAPGTYTYYNGQQMHCTAVPNNGYQLGGWTVSVFQDGMTLLDTTVSIAVSDFFELFGGWTVDEGENGMVWNIIANFVPAGDPIPIVPEDSVAITYAVNNANWGTTNPAPGTYYYGEGDVFTVSATAYENCSLVDWKMTVYSDGAFLYEVNLGSPIPVFGDSISADMLGMAIKITAIFEGPVGIDDVDADNVKVYSTEGQIVVLGAEGQMVSVYDVNGRVLDRKDNAAERVEFNVANTGVYLVKVGNAAARRVVVVR